MNSVIVLDKTSLQSVGLFKSRRILLHSSFILLEIYTEYHVLLWCVISQLPEKFYEVFIDEEICT